MDLWLPLASQRLGSTRERTTAGPRSGICAPAMAPALLLLSCLAAGEMDLWYSLASLAFVGGSMVAGVGGHNLSEAAFCSCAVVVGELPRGRGWLS